MRRAGILSFELTVLEERRLDLVLREALQARGISISRVKLKAYFEEKAVVFDRQPRSGAWIVTPGSHSVEISGLDEDSLSQRAAPSPRGSFLPIVYEDDEILVLHKQSGIPSIPHSPEET